MDSGVDLSHTTNKKKKKLSLDHELEEENSFLGFPPTQQSGGHENTVEKRMKKRKNDVFETQNSSETELEAEKHHIEREQSAKDGMKKTKKHKDVNSGSLEAHEKSEGKEKKKNIEASSERKAKKDRGEFEEKPLEYNEESVKEKKKLNRRLEEEFEDNHRNDIGTEENYEESVTEKKKKNKKRKSVTDEGIKNGAEEEGQNPGSSAKSKSKEKSGKKPKERKTDSGSDVDKSDKSSTDYRPLKKKRKSVTFSDQVEVCQAEEMKEDSSVNRENDAGIANACDGDNLIWGRFTKEEDQKIRNSVSKYIKEQGLDENEGLDMILNCKKHPKVRNCWKEIAGNLPWRSQQSVYIRAHILYERSEEHCWTKDEIEFVKSFEAEHGKKWNKLAKILGKSRYHVKDTWRRIRRGEMNKGSMSQDEYQRLFDLVNHNLRLKASQREEKPTRRQIRKNINWEAIADKMETRDHVFCCKKWYSSLTSSMVDSGEWYDGADAILLRRLLETNAFDEEAVEWNDLLEDRSGEICHKRWKQMAKHLGEHRSKPFLEKLELLVRRYAPELME